MTKPIEQANKYCRYCANYQDEWASYTITNHQCSLYPAISGHAEPCTLEDWARCPFNPANAEAKPEQSARIEELLKLKFDSQYLFYIGCSKYLKKSRQDIDPNIVGLNLDNTSDRQRAWEKVVRKFANGKEKEGQACQEKK